MRQDGGRKGGARWGKERWRKMGEGRVAQDVEGRVEEGWRKTGEGSVEEGWRKMGKGRVTQNGGRKDGGRVAQDGGRKAHNGNTRPQWQHSYMHDVTHVCMTLYRRVTIIGKCKTYLIKRSGSGSQNLNLTITYWRMTLHFVMFSGTYSGVNSRTELISILADTPLARGLLDSLTCTIEQGVFSMF